MVSTNQLKVRYQRACRGAEDAYLDGKEELAFELARTYVRLRDEYRLRVGLPSRRLPR